MKPKKDWKQALNKYGLRWILFAAVLAFFLVAGLSGPVLFDDSGSYMRIRWHEGVMPVYPVILLFNQYVFGDTLYLWAVAAEQAVLGAFAVTVLEETVRKRFGLHPAEGVLICILALYPYTIEMPTAVMTQAILTEGIAYSLYYLFFTVLLRAVWEKSYARLAAAFGMTLLLSAVRSQLQILFGVCGIIFLYLVCMRRGGKKRMWLRLVAGAAGCIVISLLGICLTLGVISGYRAMLRTDQAFYMFGLKVQLPEVYETVLEERRQEAEQAQTKEADPAEGQEETALADKAFTTSQYVTLIFSRGMYEADYEDAGLFEDPVLRGLYLTLYEAVDEERQRYVYARDGLWMWKDIVGGIGKIGSICFKIPSEYYVENAVEVIASDQFGDIRASHLRTIGMTLVGAHFGRFLYHTLKLLPQAFISTVFFQYAPLYGLCHFLTAVLYLAALALMIWGYRDARVRKEEAEMMALALGTNVVLVLVISLVFFGQQRYLIYNFGTFYMAFYLLLRQMWRVRGRHFFRRKKQNG